MGSSAGVDVFPSCTVQASREELTDALRLLEWLHTSSERSDGHGLPAADFYNLELSTGTLDLGREYITWRQWVTCLLSKPPFFPIRDEPTAHNRRWGDPLGWGLHRVDSDRTAGLGWVEGVAMSRG